MLSCCIEGLLPAWWQQAAMLARKSADGTGHGPYEKSK
jgi:hypothetical protein